MNNYGGGEDERGEFGGEPPATTSGPEAAEEEGGYQEVPGGYHEPGTERSGDDERSHQPALEKG